MGFGLYLVQRLMASALVLPGVVLVTFLILHLAPGDPASILALPGASPEQIDRMRSQLGLDLPLHVQFVRYLGRVVRGDLGTSLYTGEPVAELILQRLPVTLSLAIGSLVLSFVLGGFLGTVAAMKRGSILDYGVVSIAVLGFSVPVYWLGIIMILAFAIKLRLLPVSGYVPLEEGILTYSRYMLLPWISLAIESLGLFARITRASILEELGQQYVTTARAKGLLARMVIIKHVLPNAGLHIITVLGLQLGTLMGGAVLTENVFSLPGMGRLIVRAISFRDYPIVQGTLLIVALLFVWVNFVVDLLYTIFDPRVRIS